MPIRLAQVQVRVPSQPSILADGVFSQHAEDCRSSGAADLQGFLRGRANTFKPRRNQPSL